MFGFNVCDLVYALSVPAKPEHRCDRECTPRDSVDALIDSWKRRRPALDMSSVAVVARLGRVRDHIDEQLAVVFERFGLTAPSFAVLVTLARLGDDDLGVSQRRLADELNLTPGTVSVRVDRLLQAGLVSRTPDPDARRNVRIALTDKARDLFERVVPAHLSNEARLLAALTDEEQTLLADLLRKLLVEFEGSASDAGVAERLGLLLAPAHVTIEMRESVGLPRTPGLLVRTVEPDSPAAAARIVAGDLLIRAGGRELRSSSSLYAAIDEASDHLAIILLRGDQPLEVTIGLARERNSRDRSASQPAHDQRGAHAV
jgi:DNA-binding MarR family transcriptional regulator